jgi:hypothetical protein
MPRGHTEADRAAAFRRRCAVFPEEDVPALDELYPKIIDFDDEEYTGDKQPAE